MFAAGLSCEYDSLRIEGLQLVQAIVMYVTVPFKFILMHSAFMYVSISIQHAAVF